MSSPFPLLRLPRVVLCEVFKSLSIGEKIKLSLCSKKISAQINIARLYSQKVIVGLDVLNENIKVYSENIKNAFKIINCTYNGRTSDLIIQQYRIEGHTVPVIPCPKGIITLWKNNREGFLSVIRYLLKIFRCKFSVNCDHNSGSLQPIISKLFDLQVEFKTLFIYLYGLKDDNLFWNQISNKLGLVKDLSIYSLVNPGFIPVFASWPQSIFIMSSAWFTLEYLLACTCTKISLDWSYLDNKDMDAILRKWKAGGFPNLEYLYVGSHNITKNGELILGMNPLKLRGKVIQTDDGSKKASIRIDTGFMEMSVSSV
ncbi:hypothetical protein CRE_22031 [Caenorhabditis remanei]|uniref:F-box domain-containing protein n=1 Tax=Caenorhabditis remanei TaxID=31234 RepID=E3N3G8_CAERE|nr:hypothetical protein CRE_22031 [Caenorhabditis remanei]